MSKTHVVEMSYGEADEEELEGYPVFIQGMIWATTDQNEYNTAALSQYDFSQADLLDNIFVPVQQGMLFCDVVVFRPGFVKDWFFQFEQFLTRIQFHEIQLFFRIDEQRYLEVPDLTVFYHSQHSFDVRKHRRVDRWAFEDLRFPSPGLQIDI